jgi:hypothetical protein
MHRLNQAEYNNTVRDLLGTKLRPADDFPADDRGYGYDNIADVLSMSPLQFELYERAAEMLAKEAMDTSVPWEAQHFEAETLNGTVGAPNGDAWMVWANGELPVTVTLPMAADYRVSTRVWGDQAGPEPVRMSLLAGGTVLGTYDIPATSANPQVIEETVHLSAGDVVVAVEFINDFVDPNTMDDRNLDVDWIRVEGPFNVMAANEIRERILICDPATGPACIRDILGTFAGRAWRRPLAEPEIDALVALVTLATTQGDTLDRGIEVALRAILVSPHFLFRPELDASPTSLTPHPLNDHELASRLSYFIWSSMPDDALFAAAAEGRLRDPAEISAQVTRMLNDPKADALVDNFAGQWLYIRALKDHSPDYMLYPSFDEKLREAMREESILFFREFLSGDLGLHDMLNADFTYMNDRLAQHYGLPAVGSPVDLVRTPLSGDQRRGLLTQGTILTVTSFPTRTSPVKRGKWVLSQLLCDAPDPPPPGVEGLIGEVMPTASLRERLEQHREAPQCAGCHVSMDQLGFGLERYDAIGAYRTADQGFPVDSTGKLPTGETFDGALQMQSILHADPRFGQCVTQHLMTYALGRGMEPPDDAFLRHLSGEFSKGGYKLRHLIELIATSEPFRIRRGEAGGSP